MLINRKTDLNFPLKIPSTKTGEKNLAKKPETLFKEKVLGLLSEVPNAWFVKNQGVSTRGLPDICGCINGRFVALELKKSDKEKKDPLQTYVLEQITGAGGLAFYLTPENLDEILGFIRKQTSF